MREASCVTLLVSLANLGSKEVLIPFGDLPWDRDNMNLNIVSSRTGGKQLAKQMTIEDPLPGPPWKVEKGERLEGKIVLNEAFPDVARELLAADLALNWYYELEKISGQPALHLSGCQTIPRFKEAP